jgi:septal ring factor EnvC (AmiA/AmiB activator)
MSNVVLIGVGVGALAAGFSGPGTASDDGDMRALVTEIRGLRVDLNRVAGANIRSQLLFGRLQLQEQRTVTLSRQLDTIQEQLAKTVAQRAELEDRLKEMEESPRTDMPLEVRQGIERNVRRELTSLQAREQQLRQQQSSLSAAVADEQARWTDFSSRLDELERALIESRR